MLVSNVYILQWNSLYACRNYTHCLLSLWPSYILHFSKRNENVVYRGGRGVFFGFEKKCSKVFLLGNCVCSSKVLLEISLLLKKLFLSNWQRQTTKNWKKGELSTFVMYLFYPMVFEDDGFNSSFFQLFFFSQLVWFWFAGESENWTRTIDKQIQLLKWKTFEQFFTKTKTAN